MMINVTTDMGTVFRLCRIECRPSRENEGEARDLLREDGDQVQSVPA